MEHPLSLVFILGPKKTWKTPQIYRKFWFPLLRFPDSTPTLKGSFLDPILYIESMYNIILLGLYGFEMSFSPNVLVQWSWSIANLNANVRFSGWPTSPFKEIFLDKLVHNEFIYIITLQAIHGVKPDFDLNVFVQCHIFLMINQGFSTPFKFRF